MNKSARNALERTYGKTQTIVYIKANKSPPYCPTSEHQLWNQHPRVFIELNKQKPKNRCPYCSTVFELIN
jgi:uncharacterized Zn-finger protein